jgi:hypothetical protein
MSIVSDSLTLLDTMCEICTCIVPTHAHFKDYNNIIITESGINCLVELSNYTFTVTDKGFIFIKLILNFDNTNLIKFVTNNKPVTNMQIGYNEINVYK